MALDITKLNCLTCPKHCFTKGEKEAEEFHFITYHKTRLDSDGAVLSAEKVRIHSLCIRHSLLRIYSIEMRNGNALYFELCF